MTAFVASLLREVKKVRFLYRMPRSRCVFNICVIIIVYLGDFYIFHCLSGAFGSRAKSMNIDDQYTVLLYNTEVDGNTS